MLALYRSGRRGEALDAYRRLRTLLVRDLGLEPSAALGKLQRSILMTRPDAAPSAGTGTGRLASVG
jgi:DNA-binding SARP family transcriptional activator